MAPAEQLIIKEQELEAIANQNKKIAINPSKYLAKLETGLYEGIAGVGNGLMSAILTPFRIFRPVNDFYKELYNENTGKAYQKANSIAKTGTLMVSAYTLASLVQHFLK